MTSHPFGTGWRFGPASADSDRPEFDDSGFAEVTLPHTVVPLSWRDWEPAAWERVWMYRKRFNAPSGAEHRRVFLDFAAAMTRATVTLNGAEIANHLGGYLPFSVEVSSLVRARGNVLAVRLDSTFNLNVPPDRPAPEPATSVDYWQPGGIYRDATRLEFRAVDRYGAPRAYVGGQVGFEVEGPAVLVGDNPFDFAAAGGAGAVWVRSRPGAGGTVTVRASHPDLGDAVARIRVR